MNTFTPLESLPIDTCSGIGDSDIVGNGILPLVPEWPNQQIRMYQVEKIKLADYNAMIEALIACDGDKLTQLVNAAIAENAPPTEILNQGLIAGMDIVGDKMENGDMFIPEVLMAAQAMMKKTVDAIVESGLRDQVKIMIGGAPVTQAFCDEIGADGFAPDAGSAAKMAKSFAA
jgi:methanogenic corrinoid protein MtbC1